MCTAVSYKTHDFYFGRTLDYDFSYGEEVVVMPRNFPLKLRHLGTLESHYAVIGMAHVAEGYPLFYDAVNEKGLAMAGLNFVGNACYRETVADKQNVAQFEFIPWILGRCASVAEARELLGGMNLTGDAFAPTLPPAQLHWILADRETAITVESVRDGLKVYGNPVGVLANNPSFPEQMLHLSDFMHLSPDQPENRLGEKLGLQYYSRGMGALGLPGDLSSRSRFVRAAFVKLNSLSGSEEWESVSQFFHILGAVEQPRGCCHMGAGKYEISIYTSCCNTDKGIYYYRTYDNPQIVAVDMHRCDLGSGELSRYGLVTQGRFLRQN